MDNIFFDKKKLLYCGDNVIIGKTVRIRQPEKCIILDGTIIDDFTYISCPITIGRNCHISSNVNISGGDGHFFMGNYSTLSSHCSVHCASSDYSEVSLDLPSVPEDLRFGGKVSDVKINDFVTVGTHSCILPGSILRNGTAFGAYTLINGVYDEWSLYVGIPSRKIKDRDKTELEILFNKL